MLSINLRFLSSSGLNWAISEQALGDSWCPCGPPGARSHRVGDPWLKVTCLYPPSQHPHTKDFSNWYKLCNDYDIKRISNLNFTIFVKPHPSVRPCRPGAGPSGHPEQRRRQCWRGPCDREGGSCVPGQVPERWWWRLHLLTGRRTGSPAPAWDSSCWRPGRGCCGLGDQCQELKPCIFFIVTIIRLHLFPSLPIYPSIFLPLQLVKVDKRPLESGFNFHIRL